MGRFARWCALAVACGAALASGVANAAAGQCIAHSPAHRVALVELYSSEGCNSCPPADNWLGQWKQGGAAQGVVPLALHVDYWNSLGWTDRFSQHRFTERQQTLTDVAGAHTIYTPEVFVAGREMRHWSSADSFADRVRQIVAQPASADVAVELKPRAGSPSGAFDIDAQFTSHAATADPLNAYVAVYENALTSQVRAGENSGATLHHERVVRQWIGPVSLAAGHAQIHHDVTLDAVDAGAPADRFGVVAFVENAATSDVLQAADLAACH
ncbi:DUF1223 domain-containing protein [Paraburkholderia acidicola]|uniref:DUF1223 domain-containing protein n=1 Tax=Paraburkholderia acidicola TaxID=1912599 RepID=A0A2A4F5G4_9BURK|nr:DUF1223 domain-containing protein [Paraburkholderia acidicola]